MIQGTVETMQDTEAGRVKRLARILLNAYGTYDAARDGCTKLRHDALSSGDRDGEAVAFLWDSVTIQLTEWEHIDTAARGEGAY